MSLVRQVIDIPFAGGIDEKSDPKQSAPGTLLTLENGVFDKIKRINKRPRLEEKSSPGTGSGTLVTEYNGSVITSDGKHLYVSASVDATPKLVGSCPAVLCEQHDIIGPSVDLNGAEDVASDVNGNWRFTLAVNAGYPRWSFSRADSGVVVYSGDETSGISLWYGCESVRVVAFGSGFLLFYREAGSYPLKMIAITSPTDSTGPVFASAVSVGTYNLKPSTDGVLYDACVIGGTCYLAMYNTMDQVEINTVSPAYTVSSAMTMSAGTLLGLFVSPPGAVGSLILGWSKTNEIKVHRIDSGTVGASRVVTTTYDPLRLTGVVHSRSPDVVKVFCGEYDEDTPGDWDTHLVTISNWASSTDSVFVWGACPCARAFSISGHSCIPVLRASEMQSSIFVVGQSTSGYKAVLARYAYGSAGTGSGSAAWPTSVLAGSTGSFPFMLHAFDGDNGVAIASIVSKPSQRAIDMASGLHIDAGVLALYDGSTISEHGFLIAPEDFTITGTSGAGHTYSYQAVFAWSDRLGQIHRSATAPVSVSTPNKYQWQQTAAIAPGATTTITVPTLSVTGKQRPSSSTQWHSDPWVEIYRTTDGGTVYYKVVNVSMDGTAATVTATDNVTDEVLATREQLYTTGNVLDVDPAPMPRCMCEHNRRVWIASSTAPGVLSYSRKLVAAQEGSRGIPVEFSAAFTERVSGNNLAVNAIASMDEKIVIFCRSKIYYIVGEGADDTGANGYFTAAPLPFDVGALPCTAVAKMPNGLVFQSDKGIYLLNRSLGIEYLGQSVEDSASGAEISCAMDIASSNQIRLGDSAGNQIFVYDYLIGQWSIWPVDFSPTSMHAHTAGGPLVVSSDGGLYAERDWSSESGDYVSLKVGTPWVHVAGLGGFERLRRILVTGDFKSDHRINWQLFVDYNNALPAQSGYLDCSSTVAPTFATNGDYQIRIDVVTQRCKAFRLVLWDSSIGETNGEGMSLSGLTLEIGAKRGLSKLPVGRISG